MKPIVKEKLLKESAELEALWKHDPLLKKQKAIKEKMPKRRRPRTLAEVWSLGH